MAKIFGKKQSETEPGTGNEINENHRIFQFPTNISLKEEGSFIEGIYRGCLVRPGNGFGGGDLILAVFESETMPGVLHTCVAGSQIVKFLQRFEIGNFLKITRDKTVVQKNGNKYATYSFEFDSELSIGNLDFISANELPEPKSNPMKQLTLASNKE